LIQWQVGSEQESIQGLDTGLSWLVGTQISGAFMVVCGIYGVSALLNFGVTPMKSRRLYALSWRGIRWSVFWSQNRQLWADPLGGMSLHVTTLCWGAGAVLQFAVLRWAQDNAELSLQQGAYLQAVVALGRRSPLRYTCTRVTSNLPMPTMVGSMRPVRRTLRVFQI
jgi:hypothetical protein